VSPLDEVVKTSEQYLKILNLNGRNIDGLRKLTVKQLIDSQQTLQMKLREAEHRVTSFQPVVDGEIIPEWPIEAIRKGSAKNVAIMAGNSLDEMKAMSMMDPAVRDMDEAGMLKRLNDILPPDLVPGLVDVYRDALKKRGSKADPADIMGTINTDIMFRISTIELVEAQRDNGVPAYNYLFTYKSPAMGGVLGAMHGLDNPFLFGGLDANFTGSGPEVENLAVKIQDSCVAFARTGDPSCKSIGKWPVYGKDRLTMILDKETRVEAAPYEAERRAWDKFNAVFVRLM
jgi:para-nitrobenzyl esterase